MICSYKLRAKHKKYNAYWEATILAPDLLTAALFLQKRAHTEDIPSVTHKNRRRYTLSGNKAFYRNVKLDLLRSGKKVTTAKNKKEMEEFAQKENDIATSKFYLCKIIEETPFVFF